MITREKLEIFNKYNGDGDLFLRCSTKLEQDYFGPTEWITIDELLHDVELIKSELTSPEYRGIALEKIKKNTDEETFHFLINDKI